MELKCLALACSPRKEGNTALLAGRAIEACLAAGCRTEFLYLADYRYLPCCVCEGCYTTGRRVVKDDAGLIFDKILAADRLILAAPVFSMGICVQAKMFIDRAQQFWAAKYILGKDLIVDQERPARRGIFDGVIQVARYFFKILEINLTGTLCYTGVDKKGDILKNTATLEEAYRFGQKLSEGNPAQHL
jgi:multimeric flavodoxin WrbA